MFVQTVQISPSKNMLEYYKLISVGMCASYRVYTTPNHTRDLRGKSIYIFSANNILKYQLCFEIMANFRLIIKYLYGAKAADVQNRIDGNANNSFTEYRNKYICRS